ncbi:Mannosyl oligosaccharide glucosidase [Luteitalea pratensis]|uniref:Mannosyl oligosaccharide glucosidase n=1 Tax=Luteitalea pratensis TaxID=1855912 RepID=A0A143PM93_LUTPR|nr:glucosidase [Luteitalea pratensis]AMY09717.1 Mannosyl oligosaccharide glucosidase [Luteitalea pratensis]
MSQPPTAEHQRLAEARVPNSHWRRWGPYVSDRAWGTVREDYSTDGRAWEYFPHDHARSRAYRWNEDGIAGISDRKQEICFALTLWNGQDPILKERFFGLSGTEGNHGEDLKEYYFHEDATPTHSYLRLLYKYPQRAYPYADLVATNRRRTRQEPEYELIDTGVFDDHRYFDVFVEYAKAGTDDVLMRITVVNRGPEAASLHVLPTAWFRNIWSWSVDEERPCLHARPPVGAASVLQADTSSYGTRYVYFEGTPPLLFTENDTNTRKLFGIDGPAYAKDGINDHVVDGNRAATNPEARGTKASGHYVLDVPAGGEAVVRVRFTTDAPARSVPFADFDAVCAARRNEADAFYGTVIPADLSADAAQVMRQAFAGLLWNQQFYHFDVKTWLDGDPGHPRPPAERRAGRNADWRHLYNDDIISMPDKWEYPWYAAWDLAFHCVPLALVDTEFAKRQLLLILREWYMHPNGQLPSYEWNFADVNPPVHAWAAWRVYEIDRDRTGTPDITFLKRVFHKLMLNFTWWVNRKDEGGNNVFEGGFLGLDNIGVFDRSQPLSTDGHLEQSDGSSWMAMYSLNLLTIALELARHDPAFEDVATKFWEHFLYISYAMGHQGADRDINLWDEADGFFYDVLRLGNGQQVRVKIRSMVGLIPLFAVATLDSAQLDSLPAFMRRMFWFLEHRPEFAASIARVRVPGQGERGLFSIVGPERLRQVLGYMLDEREFLSPFGIRALSRHHEREPFVVTWQDANHRVDYEPGESGTSLFGGNSNWRGPIWFPVNYLLIESLRTLHQYFGDDYRVECPTGSGEWMTLAEVADEIARRLARLFLVGRDGRRPVWGRDDRFDRDPLWSAHIPFHEYFHADTGKGLGASHQTGWTSLIACLLAGNMLSPFTTGGDASSR